MGSESSRMAAVATPTGIWDDSAGALRPYSDPTATLQRPYNDTTDPTETLQRPYKRPYRDPTAYFYILKDQESRLGIQGGYIRTLPKGLRIPRTLRETAIESDADVPGGASEACGPDQPRVWGINGPYSDPTATL